MTDVETFKRFLLDRVRRVEDGYPFLSDKKILYRDAFKAYNRWTVSSGAPRMEINRFVELCDQNFPTKSGHYYWGLEIFLDEDDVEDFDKTHQDQRIEALKDRNRYLEAKLKEETDYTKYLQECIKRKEQYTEKLLNKIALLYVGLPDDYRPQSEIQHSSS